MSLTLEQQATNAETWKHISRVRFWIGRMVESLLKRAQWHDQSKLTSPEVELFTEVTAKLAGCTYGSDEYKAFLKQLGPALEHHYRNNRHHPEHWPNGVDDMTLVDLMEMFCDWKAATERHNDGDIHKSIDINAGRFGLSPQLVKILHRTATSCFQDWHCFGCGASGNDHNFCPQCGAGKTDYVQD